MNTSLRIIAAVIATAALAASANAAIIPLELLGKAGPGLLAGNENGTVNFTGAAPSGGELGSGIFFNDATLVLTLNVGWGSGNGFTDLTGNAIGGHIHGPTASGGTDSFTQNAGILIGLDDKVGWNDSASNGGFNGSVTLSSSQAADLLAGKLYVNVHTNTNGGGEIRGNMVVPEPGSSALIAFGAGALLLRRRRRQRAVSNAERPVNGSPASQ